MPVWQPHRIWREVLPATALLSSWSISADVAVVFSDRDFGPDLRSAREIDSRLLQEAGNSLQAVDDVLVSLRFVRVLQYKRRIQSIADQLDIQASGCAGSF